MHNSRDLVLRNVGLMGQHWRSVGDRCVMSSAQPLQVKLRDMSEFEDRGTIGSTDPMQLA